jgi:diaminopimelate decarboxylase
MALDEGEPRIDVGRTVAGLDPAQLIAEHGSPLYVYDADALTRRASLLRSVLPERADLAYAVKANSSPGVLGALLAAGLGADVASGGELAAVLRAGFAARDVVFTGPGKTDAEIASALRAGVGAVTIESLDELDSVIAMAADADRGQGLMFRLSTDTDGEETPIIGAGGSAKFGMTDGEADEGLGRLRATAVLAPEGPYVFRGFHAFGASNVRAAEVLVAGITELARRAESLAERHGLSLDLLDGGGGLGIPYADDEAPLDVMRLGAGVRSELDTWAGRRALRDARLLLEPGRWLTGPSGTYLCSVVRTKRRGDRSIAITDGGIHHLLRPRLVGQDHRVRPVGAAAAREVETTADVVGPLCTGLDFLATAIRSPEPRHGDLYAVLDAGAYGYAESMPLFLSHPLPAEIMIDQGRVTVSRSRVEPQ